MPEPSNPRDLTHSALPAEGLSAFEAFAVRAMTRWNDSALAKRVVYLFVRYISHTWIQLVISNRLQVHGAEHLRALDPARGVLLIGNHRTFWDMYITTSVITAHNDFARKFYYPVRSRFFYSHPLGFLLNFAVSGGSMWPPMASGFDRSGRSAAALAALARVLDQPQTLAGLHPEGTRNRSPDPLSLLPAKGGTGRLVLECHPDVLVVPFFLCGVTDDFLREVVRNFSPPGRRGPPIQLTIGQPVPARELQRDVAPIVIARELLEEVRALGQQLTPGDAPRSEPPGSRPG